jgi:hypothetical protein
MGLVVFLGLCVQLELSHKFQLTFVLLVILLVRVAPLVLTTALLAHLVYTIFLISAIRHAQLVISTTTLQVSALFATLLVHFAVVLLLIVQPAQHQELLNLFWFLHLSLV